MRTHNDDREGFHCGHCKKDFEGFGQFGGTYRLCCNEELCAPCFKAHQESDDE
jgi:hypothetical protein